jgi:ParB family chromosome partitioning protein
VDHVVAQPGGALLGGFVLDELHADHQAAAAHLADAAVPRRNLFQAVERVLAHGGGVLDQAFFQQPDGLQRGGAGDGVAAKGVAVRALRPVHDALARDHGAQRHAGGNTLGHADDVGLDAPVLHGEHLAGAAHAGLHFVGDEQDAVLVTQRAQRL